MYDLHVPELETLWSLYGNSMVTLWNLYGEGHINRVVNGSGNWDSKWRCTSPRPSVVMVVGGRHFQSPAKRWDGFTSASSRR